MSDFVSGFWDLYVKVIVLGSVLSCAVFLWTQSKGAPPVAAGQEAEKMDHIWDETLQEYNNPLPLWWSYLFYITVIFALVYLALYPGFGSFKGMFGWTSHETQYGAEMKAAEDKYAPMFNKFLKMDVKAVAADKEANEMGKRLFLTYCAQCHGSDGGGAKGFPSLKDADWLYGSSADAIKTSIAEGRNGVMPAWGPQLGAEGVKDVANFVRSLSGQSVDSARAARGKDIFATNCGACHGPEGKGSLAAGLPMGAPNLTDKVWLHGSSEKDVVRIITEGMQNQMPSWKNFLGDAKIHLLTAYVYSLSPQHEEPAAAVAPAPAADAAPAAAAPAASVK